MLQRGTSPTGHRCVFGEEISHSVETQSSSMNAGKQNPGISPGRFFQPCLHDGARVCGEWCATFLAALALTTDVCAHTKNEILRQRLVISERRKPVCTASSSKAWSRRPFQVD
jgi:hypothetical protein